MVLIHLRLTAQDFNLVMASLRNYMNELDYQPTAREYYINLREVEHHLCRQAAISDNYEIVQDPDEESEI